MAACEAQCAQAILGATPVLAAVRLHVLRTLLQNSRDRDLCPCLRACCVPATKTRKHDVVQDMLHHAPDVHMLRVMLTQLTSSMTVEALKQGVSAMRMIGFTVPSAKTMARSRADIVNAIIDCDKPSKSPPANVEGPAGVVHPGRPGSEPAASSSMEFAPAADTEFRSVLVAYDAGVGTKRTRRKMHKRWSKLALRASLPKRIRRALADSTVAAVRGWWQTRLGRLWTVFLKLTAAPQKKRRPRKRFRSTLVQTSWLYIWICRSSEPAPALGPSARGASALHTRHNKLGMYIPAGCGSYVGCRYARSICMHARQSRDQRGAHISPMLKLGRRAHFTIDLNGKNLPSCTRPSLHPC